MDLFIDTYGTKIGSSGERIVLSFPNIKEKKEYPARRISKIIILRPASLTTHAVQLALKYDVDIVYLGSFGKPVGRFFSSEPKGLATLRRAQLETSVSVEKSFDIAKEFVRGKCANQIEYLRYLGYIYKKDFSKELLQAQTIFDTIDRLPVSEKSKEQLLGIEGYIADRYFFGLKKLYKFPGRKPQGRDPFNSAFNYAYAILRNEVEKQCLYIGLDPYLGLYHVERYGKMALVYDLIEEFRVPVVDSVIFPLFVEKKLNKKNHFEQVGHGQYQLSAEGKAVVVKAVKKTRLSETTVWRGKNYTLEDIIKNQVQALARHFLDKEKHYQPFSIAKLLTKYE